MSPPWSQTTRCALKCPLHPHPAMHYNTESFLYRHKPHSLQNKIRIPSRYHSFGSSSVLGPHPQGMQLIRGQHSLHEARLEFRTAFRQGLYSLKQYIVASRVAQQPSAAASVSTHPHTVANISTAAGCGVFAPLSCCCCCTRSTGDAAVSSL